MRKNAAALLLAVLFVSGSSAALALTAEELAAKNVAAKGGIDRLHALKSLRLSGKLLVNDDATRLQYVALIKPPQAVRIEATLQGLTLVQAYDGTQAWRIDPFQGRKDPEKLSADDAKGLAEDAADFMGPLVDYAAKGYVLDYLGTEDIDGTEAHKLRVTRSNGDISYVYLDPDYFLEIRTVNRRIEHGVPIETVTDYSDYEQVAGAYLAFAQASGPKGSTDRQKLQIEKAEANAELADASFNFPGAATPGSAR
jgi:outer membrane lipoprotein-sorting protein